ncbi:hypothetical protein K437DRAFT_258556, partial [Tilletiaria anomala UBC 951]
MPPPTALSGRPSLRAKGAIPAKPPVKDAVSSKAAPSHLQARSRPSQSNGAAAQAQEAVGISSSMQHSRRRIGVEYADEESQRLCKSRTDMRVVVWLDIDNTLYKQSTRIADMMGQRIRAYFINMGLSEEEAEQLHMRYYKEYGLAIRGLVKHHKIDPLDYDQKCDASLPLENILKPDREVQRLLADLDRTKCRVFALTNAYRQHAKRVLALLGLDTFVEGIIYCDYANEDFTCKPEPEYYLEAMEALGVDDPSKCFFVDDSAINVRAAKGLNWGSCILYREIAAPPSTGAERAAVSSFSASVLLPRANTRNGSVESRKAANGSATIDSIASPSPNGLLIPSSEGDFDKEAIQREFKKLPHSMRIRLLHVLLDACVPGDLAALSRALGRYMRSTRDVISALPDAISLKIFERLEVKELLRCRQVSKKWCTIAANPLLWHSHALALTEGDPVPLTPPDDENEWEGLVRGLYFRERNWARGLAQRIDFFEGHTGFVTSIKLKGRDTLVTGSYDETIRVWDLKSGQCCKVLKAKAISCLDFLLDDDILCAGLYDTGRVMVWDMKTWELLHTLSGHNRGIRNIALNKDYLVSVGQDKAIVVWDWRTGNKIVRFGQQSNVSLGVSIIDSDKIVAVTVDGIIRTFSIPAAKMIAQFDLHKLGEKNSQLAAKLATLGGSSAMLQWFAASGNTMTIASKDLVVHLEWREHIVAVKESVSASNIRRSASIRGVTSGTVSHTQRESLQSPRTPSRLGLAPSTSGAPLGARRDSTASNSSVMSTASGRRSVSGGHSRSSSTAPSATPLRSTVAITPALRATVVGASKSPLLSPSVSQAPFTPTPKEGRSLVKSTSATFPSSPTDGPPSQPSTPKIGQTRYAPNLVAPPTIVEILKTPDMATGCVDPAKRRIVCSTFSSRAGSDRRLYASTYSIDKGSLPGEVPSDPTLAPGSSADRNKDVDAGAPVPTADGTSFVVIGGAWQEREEELQAPPTRPLALVVDHESIVAGCQDGTVYRLGFIGSKYGQVALAPTAAEIEEGRKCGQNGRAVEGVDAVIEDLTELRHVWAKLMLPPDAPLDHPGRINLDALKTIGL